MSVLSRNNVRVSGRGEQLMVFAHGFGCDQSMWRHVAPAFEDSHRVVLFDYVGAGQTDLNAYDAARYSTLQGYASDVLEVIEALAVQQVIFVGYSVSAVIGMLAATRRPSRFSRLIHVGASPSYLNDPPHYSGGFERQDLLGLLKMMEDDYQGWIAALTPVVLGTNDRPDLVAELEASFNAYDPTIARVFAEATFFSDHRRDVASVPVPSLILQCAEDHIAPEPVGRWLADHLPHSTYHALEATGHCPHLTHPDEIIRVIRSYLECPAGAPALSVTV